MIVSILQVVIPVQKREEALELLRMNLGPAGHQAGCIYCHGYEELDNANNFVLIEEWMTQEYLERHLQSSEYKKILALMDIANEPPKINFHSIESTAGMELIKKLYE